MGLRKHPLNLIRTIPDNIARGICLRRKASIYQNLLIKFKRIASYKSDFFVFFLTAENTDSAEMEEKDRLDEITNSIIGAAIDVHRALGPGLLESAYEACLAFELAELGLKIERQRPLPIVYRGVKLDYGYRIDILVEGLVVVEIKVVDRLAPIHKAQLLSYLKLSGCKVGLLLNFNVKVLKSGIVRMVNNYPDSLRSLRAQR